MEIERASSAGSGEPMDGEKCGKSQSGERPGSRRPGETEVVVSEREVRTVCWIVCQEISPTLLHIFDFGQKSCLLFQIVLTTSRCRFVVIEFRVRGPNIPVTRFTNPQAEIHIIECNDQVFFVEAAHFFIDGFPDDETRPSNGRIGADQARSSEISVVRLWYMLM